LPGQHFGQLAEFVDSKLWLILRRHLASVHAKQHLVPTLGDQHIAKIVSQRIESELTFLLLRVMTAQTILSQQWLGAIVQRGDQKRNVTIGPERKGYQEDQPTLDHLSEPLSWNPATFIFTL